MKIPQFEGIINVITTPFGADGAINYDVLEQHIEFVIAGGVHAILPGGSTGEYYAQSFAERRRVLELRRRQGSRPPAALCRHQLDAGRRDHRAGRCGGRARATRRSCWPPRPTPCRADRNWWRTSAMWRCARHCRSSSTTSPPAPASTWISTFSRVWPTSRRSARSRNPAAASGACCSMSCVFDGRYPADLRLRRPGARSVPLGRSQLDRRSFELPARGTCGALSCLCRRW